MRDTLDRSYTKISTSIKRMEFESIEEKCASIRNSLNLVEIYRWSPRARFLREKGRLPLPPCSPEKRLPSPIYVSPIRIASNCGDSFRTCVQIQCPLHRESYLTGWSISFRFNPWNAIHHSWDSPREKRKKLIRHETHGDSSAHVHTVHTRILNCINYNFENGCGGVRVFSLGYESLKRREETN